MDIVTISGVHGVGKTTQSGLVAHALGWSESPTRPPNPFAADVLASMLYFLASFAARDRCLGDRASPAVIDRWSHRDIAVYIEALFAEAHLTSAERKTLLQVNREVLAESLAPRAAILLNDSPTEVFRRLQRRGARPGHLYEADIALLGRLVDYFEEEFLTGRFSGWGPISADAVDIAIINIAGRSSAALAGEIIDWLRKMGHGARVLEDARYHHC